MNHRLISTLNSLTLLIEESTPMLKFIGGTAGIIFLIGLIVVIGLFKLVF